MRLVTGANGLSVPTLKRVDISHLSEKAWKQQRQTLLETLDEAGFDPSEKFEKLREHNLSRGSTVPVSISLLSIQGCLDTIEAACSKNKVDFAKFVGDLSIPRLSNIAKELVWMIRDEEEETKPEGEPVAEPSGQ